jgi:hypothetical protein
MVDDRQVLFLEGTRRSHRVNQVVGRLRSVHGRPYTSGVKDIPGDNLRAGRAVTPQDFRPSCETANPMTRGQQGVQQLTSGDYSLNSLSHSRGSLHCTATILTRLCIHPV